VNVSELKLRISGNKRVFSRRESDPAHQDTLTGLMAGDKFKELLEDEVEHSFRDQEPCALAVCDIDRLGAINENQGTVFGDTVIKEIGKNFSTASAARILPRTSKATNSPLCFRRPIRETFSIPSTASGSG